MIDSAMQKYLQELEEKFMSGELDEEEEKFYTLDEDLKFEELNSSIQTLISIVVDKSYPLNGNNGLEKCIEKTIGMINDVLNMPSKQARNLNAQVAITYFGSDLELQPFRPTKNIEVNCVPNQVKSRIYDAIYESCMHMIGQYNYFVDKGVSVKGYMFIFTDGEDNGSKRTLQEMRDALRELRKKNMLYILAGCEGINSNHLESVFGAEPLVFERLSQISCGVFKFVSERSE